MGLVVHHIDQALPRLGRLKHAAVEGVVVRCGNGQKNRIQLRLFKLLRQPMYLPLPLQMLHAGA